MGELTLIYDSISVAELSVPRSDDTLVGLNLSFSKLFLGCQVKLADRSKLLNKMYSSLPSVVYLSPHLIPTMSDEDEESYSEE